MTKNLALIMVDPEAIDKQICMTFLEDGEFKLNIDCFDTTKEGVSDFLSDLFYNISAVCFDDTNGVVVGAFSFTYNEIYSTLYRRLRNDLDAALANREASDDPSATNISGAEEIILYLMRLMTHVLNKDAILELKRSCPKGHENHEVALFTGRVIRKLNSQLKEIGQDLETVPFDGILNNTINQFSE